MSGPDTTSDPRWALIDTRRKERLTSLWLRDREGYKRMRDHAFMTAEAYQRSLERKDRRQGDRVVASASAQGIVDAEFARALSSDESTDIQRSAHAVVTWLGFDGPLAASRVRPASSSRLTPMQRANRMSRAAAGADPQPRTCRAPCAHFAGDLQRSTKRAWAHTRSQRADVTTFRKELGCRLGHEDPHGVALGTGPLHATAGNMPDPSHHNFAARRSATVARDYGGRREHHQTSEGSRADVSATTRWWHGSGADGDLLPAKFGHERGPHGSPHIFPSNHPRLHGWAVSADYEMPVTFRVPTSAHTIGVQRKWQRMNSSQPRAQRSSTKY